MTCGIGEHESRCSAAWVGQHGGAARYLRLRDVAIRHRDTAHAVARAQSFEQPFVDVERCTEDAGYYWLREIILSRPEAAGADDRVCTQESGAHGISDGDLIITDGCSARDM